MLLLFTVCNQTVSCTAPCYQVLGNAPGNLARSQVSASYVSDTNISGFIAMQRCRHVPNTQKDKEERNEEAVKFSFLYVCIQIKIQQSQTLTKYEHKNIDEFD